MARHHEPKPRTIEVIVDEKMRILSEFHVVDRYSYDRVQSEFISELKKIEYGDHEYAADRIARRYITEKLAGL